MYASEFTLSITISWSTISTRLLCWKPLGEVFMSGQHLVADRSICCHPGQLMYDLQSTESNRISQDFLTDIIRNYCANQSRSYSFFESTNYAWVGYHGSDSSFVLRISNLPRYGLSYFSERLKFYICLVSGRQKIIPTAIVRSLTFILSSRM